MKTGEVTKYSNKGQNKNISLAFVTEKFEKLFSGTI